MAAAVVQTIKPRTTGATSTSATFSATPTAGNAIVGFTAGFGADITVTDNKSNTYTLQRASTVATDYHLCASTAVNISSSATFTCTIHNTANDSMNGVISEISGVTSSPVDVVPARATGTSTSPAISSGTLAQASEIVMAAASWGGGSSTTITEPSSPWVLTGEEENDASYTELNAVHQVVSSTSSVTATWTLGASRTWHAVLVSLKASGATPTSLPIIRRPARGLTMRRR